MFVYVCVQRQLCLNDSYFNYFSEVATASKEETPLDIPLPSDDMLHKPCEEERLLLILSNCRYTKAHVTPELSECFVSHGYPECDEVIEVPNSMLYFH